MSAHLAYLQHTRVEAAKLLLETEGLTFEEITFRVGYEDSSTFRKIFQKLTGLGPSDYRKRIQ